MSLPQTPGAYGLGPGDGEALWFNGALGVLKATTQSTDGRFAAIEFLGPKGFGAPLHIHRNEDEFFLVLSGDVRVQHGDDVFEATVGSLVYGPREVPHSFTVDSAEARLLLFFAPGGVEGFFREAGKPARALEIPPPDEEFRDRETLMAIAGKFGQEFIGPPVPPKD
jgi:quercetin dioxygenase-like cupin family protein